MKTLIGTLIFITAISTGNLFGQSPAEYICNNFNGELSTVIEGRSFVGETYRCDVKEQWDMAIQSEINLMATEDKYVGKLEDEWKKTAVDSENYYRGSFPFESDEYYIVNLYVPYQQKTDHFFIAQ
ncbi:hypothetical protein [Fodinibius saliphilus]|uniref:hypothetical protein n=1 Tax=Fodinibius saliphilus TaxID=1920650 RepID=UPI0011096FB0|nr:hypothetical protein [Fodinibius saliphilus]